MGLSDYPSNSKKRLEGGAVGLFVRYPPAQLLTECIGQTSHELVLKLSSKNQRATA